MQTRFEIAEGSIPGRDHVGSGPLLVGRNNQDACGWTSREGGIIAVVCDGCGSGQHSEVGAQLGVRLLLDAFATALGAPAMAWGEPRESASGWARVRRDMLDRLRRLAGDLGGDPRDVVADYLLFTIVGALVTPETTFLFSIGDGVIAVNGEVSPLGPFPRNEPPYLAYELLGDWPGGLPFQVQRALPTSDVRSILIGTDGVVDLIEAADRRLPGKCERAGPLGQFWTDDRFFRNPDAIRRRLALMNSEGIRVDAVTGARQREPGLLRDDTSLVVLRRRT